MNAVKSQNNRNGGRKGRGLGRAAAALAVALMLAACGEGPLLPSFTAAKPLAVSKVEVSDAEEGRSRFVYRMQQGQSVPGQARRWLSEAEWSALAARAKIQAIDAEERRGNVILLDGGAVYLLPQASLAKPGEPPPAFKKVTPGES